MKRRNRLLIVIVAITVFLMQQFGGGRVFADGEAIIKEGDVAMGVSPMRESVVLNPGDTYRSSLSITNPGVAKQDLYYRVEIMPFSVDKNYEYVYNERNESNQMVDWMELVSPEKGVVRPNESAKVEYTVKVPETAPGGGQYASVVVSTDFDAAAEAGLNISEAMSIAHVVLAEITGDTIYGGEIVDAGLDNLFLNGKIKTYSTVKNTGNVHALATYTTKIKSIFSDETIYNNEEDPEVHYILPERTYYDETIWDDTPMVGIFNVEYTVEFQGLKSVVTKTMVVCPWWLVLILALLIIILIVRLVTLVMVWKTGGKKNARKKWSEEEIEE